MPPTAALFASPESARVWNYWFAQRALEGPPRPAVDPFAEAYRFDHALWFHGGDEVDEEIRRHFEPLVERAGRGELDAWLAAPRDALSLVLLLDQFPRNMYRGTRRAFAHDPRAMAAAEHALARGFDRELAPAESLFLFTALVHSESVADVRRAHAGIAALVTRCTRAQQRFARGWQTSTLKHLDVLERFGRYPHRNALLGRPNTPEEEAFLQRPDFKALFMRSQTPKAERTGADAPTARAQREAAGEPPAQADGKARGPSVEAPRAPPVAGVVRGLRQASRAPSRQGPRVKILALHGFRQNGEVFRKRIRKLRQALEGVADFTFVTSPLNYDPQGETREATLAAFGELPDYTMQRVWWLSSDDNREYEGFDQSAAFLESVFRTQGPFDGVVGFAQGGTLAALLAAMQPHPTISFKFAICISAFPSRAEAHERYMRPGGITVPALHVLGQNDILVTPDRSIQLFEAFDPAHAQLAKHHGGHFVPSTWPYETMLEFVERFLPPGSADSGDEHATRGESDAEQPPPNEAATPGADGSSALCSSVYAALSAHSAASPLNLASVQSDLRALAAAGHWRDLQAIALRAHARRGEGEGAGAEASLLLAVHDTIVSLFAEQLRVDLDAASSIPRHRDEGEGGERTRRLLGLLTAPEESGPPARARPWPSPCAQHSPRIGALADKRCRLAKDIARALFLHEDMLAFIEAVQQTNPPRKGPTAPAPTRKKVRALANPDRDVQAKNLSYQRYSQARSLLISILNEADPAHAREQMRKVRAPHLTEHESPERLRARPVPTPVTEPEPMPVVPCTAEQLTPLLEYLKTNAEVDEQKTFDKGTLTTDGRLDLCKQVVGPEGIKPLLGAMMRSDRVKRLLLGNNIVGDGGAAAIAAFLRERHDSPLDCWYIAGNQITAEGIGRVCDALTSDTRVKALWLKRNPLKAAGMAPLATLLRENRTLEVLDVVNCGLLDEGLAALLGALRGPGANRTLRHLYVGTNGISARSGALLAECLAEGCTLESLYLSCNRLGDEGVEIIARGLAENRSLRRLSLASNLVGPRGARALAVALERHPSLELLDLGFTKATVAVGEYGNFLGDEGAAAMAHLLAHNDTLRSLDLLHNFISQTGVNAIRDGLAANRSLVSLQLTQFGKVHNEPGKEEIRAALKRNLALMPGGAEALAELELPTHVREIYSVYRTHM